jgi:predicted extracellular nuclease
VVDHAYHGNTQTLDHILVSRPLLGRVSRIVYARSNADFPDSVLAAFQG